MKFRVGDKVRIKRIDGTSTKSSYFVRFAKIYEGAVFTVTDITECSNGILYEGKENPYKWDEEMLELADDSSTDPSTHPLDASTGMSAVEVLEWLAKYRGKMESKECFGRMYDTDLLLNQFTTEEIADKITAYEAAKKAPKPVEVEWVDICRIIQIQDNGFKKCVYEEVLPDNDGCVDYQNAENILKKYISEHEGKYIAVNEGICRVKEDKA